MSSKITLRNPERRNWMTGWGVINRAMAGICDSINNLKDDIHLFMSPPYSFIAVDPAKYNVAITMGEQDNLRTRRWKNGTFVDLCNRMNLLIVPGTWQLQIFKKSGVTVPIVVVPLGHDHKSWEAAIHSPGQINTNALIIDRGRDHDGGQNELLKYFNKVNYMNCRSPGPGKSSAHRTKMVKEGRFGYQKMCRAYQEADVFLKWGREGWCFPLLEAMSASCLAITNCHTLPYLKDGQNCLIFHSIGELSRHLEWASKNPGDDIKRNAQKTAESLTWEKARAGVLEAIRQHAQ